MTRHTSTVPPHGAPRTAKHFPSFRAKLLIFFVGAMVAGIAVFAWGVTRYTRQAFARAGAQRSDALMAQFRGEYAQTGNDVVENVQEIAEAEGTVRMALDLSRPQADPSLYVRDAAGLASSHHLDFLELATDDGTLMSSAQWPARVGYRNDWITLEKSWNEQPAFLARLDLPDKVQLGVLAVRVVHVGDKNFYVIGGRQLDRNFLKLIALPAGARTLLYRNLEASFIPAALSDSDGPVADAEKFGALIQAAQNRAAQNQARVPGLAQEARAMQWSGGQVTSGGVSGSTAGSEAGEGGAVGGWAARATSSQPGSAETVAAWPLMGRHNELLAVLLVGSSPSELPPLEGYIRWLAVLIGACGVVYGIALSWWISTRVMRPLDQVASGMRAIAGGDWGARLAASANDEFGALSRNFNEMTRRLTGERERLVQAERVTAWREVARRLAHELKEPLFPLQITMETLAQARQTPEKFAQVFAESAETLRLEIENLREIAARFNDFAKMPAPQLQPVSVNEAVRALVKHFEPQFGGVGRPPITPELFLDTGIARINADPKWLNSALENLFAFSLEAMAAGGTLTIRTLQKQDVVRLEISHTGPGLKAESAARMFTPYGTSSQQARAETGLGLATVLSIVSDHGGRVRADSAPGAGTTFRIEFPAAFPAAGAPGARTAAGILAGTGMGLTMGAVISSAATGVTGEVAGIGSVASAPDPADATLAASKEKATRPEGSSIVTAALASDAGGIATGNLSAELAESEATEWKPRRELPEIPANEPGIELRDGQM